LRPGLPSPGHSQQHCRNDESIQIECGFFSKETLLATQDGYA
jgi:hypothetical protein